MTFFVRTVKPVTVSIFSLLLCCSLSAECKPLAATTGAQTFWRLFSESFGAASFPNELSVCTGRSYFFEVKGGAKMQSALDRQKSRILRRDNKLKPLMHEMAHVYLDMRWKVLPYPVSEPFALALADPVKCALTTPAPGSLHDRWHARAELQRCELLQLLKDVLMADAQTRDSLPLR